MTKPQITVRLSPFLLMELNHYVEKTDTLKTDVVVSAISKRSAQRCATYLGCADNVPLSQRVPKLEAKVEEIQALVKK